MNRLKTIEPNPAADDPSAMRAAPPGVSDASGFVAPGADARRSLSAGRTCSLPPDLVLEPISRRPIVLPAATEISVRTLSSSAAPACCEPERLADDAPAALGPTSRTTSPRVSIVVITRDNLVVSKLCLESVLANTDYPRYELIVVDNGSGDELLSYLDTLAEHHRFVRIVRNPTNRGFSAANNLGLAQATGDRFVLLNNDTIVPPGWLTRLIRHLDDPEVGAVGPVTNRIGNEAQIDTTYRTYGEFARFAHDHASGHRGKRFEISMLAMFCFAMRRETYEQVGPLDEEFQVGMFEDDDYAMRLRLKGFRLFCAEDVLIHHFGGASFGSFFSSTRFQDLLRSNRERFERKWGVTWQPHRHRSSSAYERLVPRIREVVKTVIPAGASVLVISKGDPELLDLEGKSAGHFPRNPDGTYTGYHPGSSAVAIGHLESSRREGAEFLLIPRTAFWWLDHYRGFAEYLAGASEEVFRDNDLCAIFHLAPALADVHDRNRNQGDWSKV